MRTVALGAAITPLLWIHAFRYVALQLFSAQEFGFAIPDPTRDQIVYGDLIGMGLALATLYAPALSMARGDPAGMGIRGGHRDRPQQRRGRGHPRAPVRQGNRRVMADPDLLRPSPVGQRDPGG